MLTANPKKMTLLPVFANLLLFLKTCSIHQHSDSISASQGREQAKKKYARHAYILYHVILQTSRVGFISIVTQLKSALALSL